MNDEVIVEKLVLIRELSGFWRRVGALIIDSVFLVGIGYAMGRVLGDQLVQLGSQGPLLGYSITALYFSLLNSSLSDGQTLGKKLFDIQVVGLNFKTIGFGRSLLRYLALTAVWLVFVAVAAGGVGALSFDATTWVLLLVTSMYSGSTIYFLLFNSKNRRTIHDFVAGTYVVKRASTSGREPERTWRGHWAISAGLNIICLGLGWWMFTFVQALGVIPTRDVAASAKAEGVESVLDATVLRIEGLEASAFPPIILATLNHPKAMNHNTAYDLVRAISGDGLNIFDYDTYNVTLVYGFSIYIWTDQEMKTFEVRPEVVYALNALQ
jgi:uncharacterized RDD family membrane protein YckC